MPFVHIELVEGRTPEAKAALAKDITEAVMKHANVTRDHVYVFFDDLPKENYYPHGEKLQ